VALLGRTLEKVVKIPYETYIENNILNPLNMTDSTFDYDKIKEKMAIGTVITSNGTVLPASILDLGWGNPMGGLFSTVRDMSKFISFMFRNNITASVTQLLDGSTINEVLKPIILDNDYYSGFGLPWEYSYNQNYWLRSKAGSLIGYRSQIAIAPQIKLGVFCVGTTDNDDYTQSMLTAPLMSMLLPVFTDTLRLLQPVIPLPPNAAVFTGLYKYNDPINGISFFQVYITGQKMNAAFSGSPGMLMTPFDETVFRVTLSDSEECRWLNDGVNDELMYFTMDESNSFATSFVFMGTQFYFVTKSCPEC